MLAPALTPIFISNDLLPLNDLVLSLGSMPIHMRKLCLTLCRVQNNKSLKLQEEITSLHQDGKEIFYDQRQQRNMHIHEIMDIFEQHVYGHPIILGFMSMVVRMEVNSEAELADARRASIEKEFAAAINDKDTGVEFNYSSLFGFSSASKHIPLSPFHEPAIDFVHFFRSHLQSLRSSLIKNSVPLLPSYNKRKNTSRSMAASFNYHSNLHRPLSSVTTLDCERLYHDTGIQCGGNTELRSAFKFTDLAPRSYYTAGGNDYWSSRYIKQLVRKALNIIPVTDRQYRYRLQRLQYVEGMVVMVYDYTSFTTSLSEMRRFVWWLGRYFRGVTVDIVDSYQGIMPIDLGEYLIAYNDQVNIYDMFDIERVVEWDTGNPDATEYGKVFYLCNNGPLGVNGNINLATLFHGICLSTSLNSVDQSNVVGDDAIVVWWENQLSFETLRSQILLLGTVHQKKFIKMQAPDENENMVQDTIFLEEEFAKMSWHYMKRPLQLSTEGRGIKEGSLLDFPGMVYAYPYEDGFHGKLGTKTERAVAFCAQVGGFYNKMRTMNDEISEKEAAFALDYIRICYRKLGLPVAGAPPYSVRIDDQAITAAVPPISADCFYEPWESVVWDNFTKQDGFIGPYVLDPNTPDMSIKEVEGIGEPMEGFKNRYITYAVDMGWAKMKMKRMWYSRFSIESKWSFYGLIHGWPIVYEYTFISEPPVWYNELLNRAYGRSVPIGEDRYNWETLDYGDMPISDWQRERDPRLERDPMDPSRVYESDEDV